MLELIDIDHPGGVSLVLTFPEECTLHDCISQSEVACQLVKFDDVMAAQIDKSWWKIADPLKDPTTEGDHHWSWYGIYLQRKIHRGWPLFSNHVTVQSPSGDFEAAISYWGNARSPTTMTGAVYISYLATAPRNRPWLVKNPCFRGAGTALLLAAVRYSYSLGHGGSTHLFSLPSEKTREYYEKFGFSSLGTAGDGTILYELSSSSAESQLKARGYL